MKGGKKGSYWGAQTGSSFFCCYGKYDFLEHHTYYFAFKFSHGSIFKLKLVLDTVFINLIFVQVSCTFSHRKSVEIIESNFDIYYIAPYAPYMQICYPMDQNNKKSSHWDRITYIRTAKHCGSYKTVFSISVLPTDANTFTCLYSMLIRYFPSQINFFQDT